MAINTKHFKTILLAKQSELQTEIEKLELDARETPGDEVEDSGDKAAALAGEGSLERATGLTETLEEVTAALQRIEDGTYGRCVLCDNEIGEKRLEAIPWTPYCIVDQEKLDKRHPQGGATL